jgi:hypothetical protein
MTPGAETKLIAVLERIAVSLEKLTSQPAELGNITQELYVTRKMMERMFSAMGNGNSSPEAIAQALNTPAGPQSIEEEIPGPRESLAQNALSAPIHHETIAEARERDLNAVMMVNRAVAAGMMQITQSGVVELVR